MALSSYEQLSKESWHASCLCCGEIVGVQNQTALGCRDRENGGEWGGQIQGVYMHCDAFSCIRCLKLDALQ